MPDVSPTKWHLAHTSWFFETFLLGPLDPAYRQFDPAFAYLFNSYYEAIGPRHPRPERGLLSRPTVDAIAAYRDHVTAGMLRLIDQADANALREMTPLIELGLHHEQQHQELALMDIKHVFSVNPLLPAYQAPRPHAVPATVPTRDGVEFAAGPAGAAVALAGNLADSGQFHPCPDASAQTGLRQMIGDVWEWTASPYVAYPRFRPAGGAIGEYNGKFMSNQMVLRGGAAVTPADHIRITYRNFFPPSARWAFSGLRLAEDF